MKNKMMMPVDVPANHEAEQGAIGCVALGAYQDAIEAGVDVACWHTAHAPTHWPACDPLNETGQENYAVNVCNTSERVDK